MRITAFLRSEQGQKAGKTQFLWIYRLKSAIFASKVGVSPDKFNICQIKHRFDDKTGTPQRRSISGMIDSV
jgi:hypothetical protein